MKRADIQVGARLLYQARTFDAPVLAVVVDGKRYAKRQGYVASGQNRYCEAEKGTLVLVDAFHPSYRNPDETQVNREAVPLSKLLGPYETAKVEHAQREAAEAAARDAERKRRDDVRALDEALIERAKACGLRTHRVGEGRIEISRDALALLVDVYEAGFRSVEDVTDARR